MFNFIVEINEPLTNIEPKLRWVFDTIYPDYLPKTIAWQEIGFNQRSQDQGIVKEVRGEERRGQES